MNLKDLIPPVIYHRLRRPARPPLLSTAPKIFSSYEEAEAACGRYDDEEIVEIVKEKTKHFVSAGDPVIDNRQTVQNMLVLQAISKEPGTVQVIEPGGACGALYFQLRHFFPGLIEKWTVVETPKMSEAGGRFFADPCLSFTSSMKEALKNISGKSLCIASGVIQYLPAPLRSLEDILSCGFEYVYITRQPVCTEPVPPIITFQETSLLDHGPGSLNVQRENKKKKTPVTYLSEAHFNEQIKKTGYSVVYNFEESPALRVQFEGMSVHIKTIGLLLKKIK